MPINLLPFFVAFPVHELEHAMGEDHITLPNGEKSRWQTPNAVQCSGL